MPVASGLSLRSVCFSRSGRPVIDRLDADLPAGAVTAVLGPSGSGKSTLLRLCNGLIAHASGSITLDDVETAAIDAPSLRRRVGLVAQRPVMLPGTVADNVTHGEPGADVDGALAAAGLDASFAAREAARLSGGEQARVAIARALVRGPRVLLLDEATAPLDHRTALHVGETLRTLAADGIGVALATHDTALAAELCDREIVLEAPS